jgi:hypothetical protein
VAGGNSFGDRDEPVTVILKGPIGVRLENELITALQTVMGPGGPVGIRSEGDGTLRQITLFYGKTAGGDEEPVLIEDDRTLREQLVLWRSGNPERWQAYSSGGEAKAMVYGADAGNNADPLLTDVSRIVRQRGFEPWRWVDTVEPAPGGGYSTIYTVPASSLAAIEWRVTSTANTPAIDVHMVENGGAPDTSNAEVIGAGPAVGGLPLRAGPILLNAGGTVQCRNTAAAGNTGNVRIWVELYSTGDTVA